MKKIIVFFVCFVTSVQCTGNKGGWYDFLFKTLSKKINDSYSAKNIIFEISSKQRSERAALQYYRDERAALQYYKDFHHLAQNKGLGLIDFPIRHKDTHLNLIESNAMAGRKEIVEFLTTLGFKSQDNGNFVDETRKFNSELFKYNNHMDIVREGWKRDFYKDQMEAVKKLALTEPLYKEAVLCDAILRIHGSYLDNNDQDGEEIVRLIEELQLAPGCLSQLDVFDVEEHQNLTMLGYSLVAGYVPLMQFLLNYGVDPEELGKHKTPLNIFEKNREMHELSQKQLSALVKLEEFKNNKRR